MIRLEFVPSEVALFIRINPNRMNKLRRAGINYLLRDRDRQAEVVSRHMHEAYSMGNDPTEHTWVDRAGHMQGASGKTLFPWSHREQVCVSLRYFPQAMEEIGFNLRIAHMCQKEGDSMGYLQLWYTKPDRKKELIKINSQQQVLIDDLVKKSYRYFHGFQNQGQNNVILTAAHMLPDNEAVRAFWMNRDWSLDCLDL